MAILLLLDPTSSYTPRIPSTKTVQAWLHTAAWMLQHKPPEDGLKVLCGLRVRLARLGNYIAVCATGHGTLKQNCNYLR